MAEQGVGVAQAPVPVPSDPAYEARYNYWKWRSLFGFCVLYLFTYTGRLNMGIALPLLKREFGWTSAQVGLLSSLLFWSYGISHLVWGRLSDKIGARWLCGIGAILSTALNWVVSFATSFAGIAIPWAINGVAQGMPFSPGLGMVNRWWTKKQRGTAMGLVIFSSGWATVVVWVLASNVAAPLWGWRGVFRFPVLLMGILGIASFFIIRNRPTDVGLKDYVEEDTETLAKEAKESTKGLAPYVNCLKDWRLDMAFLTMGLANFNRYALLTWIPMYYMESAKYDISKAGLVSLSLPVGMALGPAVAGIISDKFFGAHRYQTIAVYCLIAGGSAVMIAVTPTSHVGLGVVYLFLAGFFVYGAHGPIWTLSQDLAGRNKGGTAAGIMDFVSYAFAGFGAAGMGILLTVTHGNWPLAFMIVAGLSVLAAVLAVITKR